MMRVGLIQMTSGPTPVDNFDYLKEQTNKGWQNKERS